ncbi:MAG: LLM class F420-dependent oxidoreductase [Actinomycetota bacterium]|nr:MAG: LLM class F420-dependent oxidoreductase [Actinomycetota bacterium]
MQVGVVFPQTEIEADAGAIRAYAEGVESLGFRHVLAYDHVLGADPAAHPGWSGFYDVNATFHEPLVLFGFLAGVTSLDLVTGVVILPQRQTVLVAKQAAEVDLLCGGRLRLGVGLGWNVVEYDALAKDFTTRGRRLDQQIELMRRLWTERSITATDTDERVVGAGLAPLPVQRPIPIWFGGKSAAACRRIGRIGDGWIPNLTPGPELAAGWDVVVAAAEAAGRDPAAIGLEGRIKWTGDEDWFAAEAQRWADAGATHLSVDTMSAGLGPVDGHLAALSAAAKLLQLTAPRN